ncbi:F-box domain-containing protein [Mycena sanguinolenta]|uniref:F-box domain-containing protein n=1 Tax=Mycena sanguinolenta TaxID=230812 RepID=A0A8H6XCP6_9AGAR|nr:F-box domain-containing protein [Mycena sanguinolenta]
MADSLPDEIISEILSPALKVPEHMYSDLSPTSPFAKYSVSSSAALLVCKAWLRVATPLLYACVVIRSKAQCRALHDALRKNPDLGRFIKKLRVEGGFSASMNEILKCASKLTDVFLSLQIHSSDSSSGLISGLPLINPTRLILFDDRDNHLKNKAVVQLMDALQGCVKKWTNMHTLVLPYTTLPGAREPLVRALFGFSNLKVVSFLAFHDKVPLLTHLDAIPTLEAIEIRAKRGLKPKKKSAPPPTSKNARISSLLRWAEDQGVPRAKRIYKLPVCPATDPTFCPLACTPGFVADKIWARILFFAMLSLEPRSKSTVPAVAKSHDLMANTKRLRFLLVSKLFCRLGLPYLYREPTILHRSLPQFADRLSTAPTIGTHVRELDISVGFAEIAGTAESFARIFRHTPRLRCLNGNGVVRLTYTDLCVLGNTAGATLEEMSGISLAPPVIGNASRSPAVLAKFTALKILTWYISSSSQMPPFFSSTGTVPTHALPALEFLTLKSPDTLPVFSQMQLPSLRRVSMNIRASMFPRASGLITDFLRAHGAKLLTLRTEHPVFDDVALLTLCPNITTFGCRVGAKADFSVKDLGVSKMDEAFKHICLTTLLLNRYADSSKTREDQAWTEIFAELEAALERFPALREIRSMSYEWPTTEHAISRSVWVQAAESLLKRDIKLKDKTNAEWHPRLKVTRR